MKSHGKGGRITSLRIFFYPSLQGQKARKGFLFVLPCAMVIVLMMIVPIVRTIVFSFSQVKLPSFSTTYTGLSNFKRVFSIEEFPIVIKNTIVWIIGSMVLRVFFGFFTALIMDGSSVQIRTLRVLVLIPWTIPSIVSANSWRWMLRSDFGLVNGFLENIGLGFLSKPWLNSAATALPSVLAAYTWAGFPFVMMLFLAGLQSIPEELYESGAIDGAGKIQQFLFITIPSLRSIIIMVVVLEIISAINAFDLLFVLTGGGPGTASEILGLLIYRLGFTRFDFASASAASSLLIAAALLCFLFYAPSQIRKKLGGEL
jgi:multiple sugar transport system permease protein